MRRISLSAITLLTLFLSCDTQNNVEPIFESYFTKYYGEDGEQHGVDLVINRNDGSMVLLGNSLSQSEPISPFVVKTDPFGNIIWQRTFKGQNETAVDIEIINNESQFAVVSNVRKSESVHNICVYILNQDGSLADSLYITNSETRVAKSITQSSDNGFLITGHKAPDPSRNGQLIVPPPDNADILLLKVNSSLDLASVSDLSPGGGEHEGSGVKVFELDLNSNSYYLVFGSSDRPRKNTIEYQHCFQLIAAVPSGVFTGLHEYSEKSTSDATEQQIASTALKIPPALGDGYLVVGTMTTSAGTNDLYLTRFSKPVAPNSAAKSLDQRIPLPQGKKIEGVAAANATPDGYFIAANEIRDNTMRDIFLLRVERDGAVVWTTSFGSLEGEDTVGSIETLADGRIAIVGTVELETQKKMALFVTNANGKFSD
jgi:hypothetical protein